MTSNRVLATLTLLAAALLLAALLLSAMGMSAVGLRLPADAWPTLALPSISLPTGPALPGDIPVFTQFGLGFVAGWILRWIYGMPWSALPHAVAAWLLSWRRSATMLSLAIGCTAVLLLY